MLQPHRAIREEIISADCNPFSKFKLKNERTINRTLNLPEIKSIAELDLVPVQPFGIIGTCSCFLTAWLG